MQHEIINSSPSWITLALTSLAGLLGGGTIVRLLDSYLFRRNRSAQAEKTAAEARQINLKTDIEVSQSVIRTTVKITQMQETINQLQFRMGQQEIDLELAWIFIEKQRALMVLKGISLAELDHLLGILPPKKPASLRRRDDIIEFDNPKQ